MPTHEEKWFASVLFSKNGGTCTEKFHSNGNSAMEGSFLSHVIRWTPTSGRAELEADKRHVSMVLRDLRLEKSTPVVTPVAKRPKSDEPLLLAGSGCYVVQVSHDTFEQPLSVPTCHSLQALWQEG